MECAVYVVGNTADLKNGDRGNKNWL